MANGDDLKKIQQQVQEQLNRLDAGTRETFIKLVSQLQSGKGTLQDWENLLKSIKITADRVSDSLDFVVKSFRDAVNELSKSNTALSASRTILKDVEKSASNALAVRSGEVSINEKSLKLAKDRAAQQFRDLRDQKIRLQNSLTERNLSAEQVAKIRQRVAEIDNATQAEQEYIDALDAVLETNKRINKELGFAPQLAAGLDKSLQKLGLPSLGINEAIDQTKKLAQAAEQAGEEGFDTMGTFTSQVAKNIGEAVTATNILQAVSAGVVNSIFDLNKAQTEFRRLTGQSVDTFEALNTSLATTVQFIEQASSATQQFGINATALFDNINLQEATELSVLMGLSAEEANNLALASQSVGGNLAIGVENAIAQVNAVNAARTSAVSQKIALQDAAKASSGLTVALDGNVELLTEAAAEARALGLNLAQVEQIADGLLDIENSIKNEFIAETVLQRDLNLERARFYAQTDNVVGLVDELRKNEGLIEGFIRGGRIERQVAADALGMSVDEMGKFVLLNQSQLGISKEAAMEAAGVTEEQLKQLTITENISNAFSKITQTVGGILEPIMSGLAQETWLVYTALAAISAISMVKLISSLAVAVAQLSTITALSSPAKFAAGLAAAALGVTVIGGLIAGFASKAKSQVGDGYADSSRGPFTVTDRFGATAITTPGDNLAVSPNVGLRGASRNEASTMQLDYNQLADAIAKGAERGTSKARLALNVDGRKFADNQQVPSVLGTYKFSS